MQSIRSYLVAVLVSTICLVNFIAALNGYQVSSASARQLLESRLLNMTHAILNLSKDNAVLSGAAFSDSTIFQVWVGDRLQSKSSNASTTQLVANQPGLHIINDNGRQWQALVLRDPSSALWVIYGEPHDQYQRLIDELAVRSILPIIWVLPLIAVLVWIITGAGLLPLRELQKTLKVRSENDLNSIAINNCPKELSDVVAAINALLKRLEMALGRERQFAANAAHELRTPLAVLKISLHNHLRWLKDHAEATIPLANFDTEQLLVSVHRMEKSIEQMLALHQLTPENLQQTKARFDLKALLQTVVLEGYGTIREKALDVELVGEQIHIEADQNALHTLFTNLLENSNKYTPINGRIEIGLASIEAGSWVQVEIEDSGQGIPPAEYERVFERFYRGDQSSSKSSIPGAGIGLAIVKHVLDLHGGHINLAQSTRLGGLHVTVTLPSSQKTRANAGA